MLHRLLQKGMILAVMAFSCLWLAGCTTTGGSDFTAGKGNPDLLLGNQYARDGLFREAADAYRKSLKTDPDYPTTNRNLGMVLVKLGSYREAAKHLEKSLNAYRNDFDTNWYLGEALRGMQKYSEAVFHYQSALKAKPDSTRALKSLAWSYFKVRYYSAALEAGRKLRQLDPQDTQTALIVSRVLIKMKKPAAALKVINASKSSASKANLPFLLSVEGDIHLERGDCDLASGAYRQALESQPLLAGALLGYGRCFYRQKDTEKAVRYITRAVRVRPTLHEGYYYLGRMLEASDPRRAAQYYRRFHAGAAKDPQLAQMVTDMKRRYSVLKKRL